MEKTWMPQSGGLKLCFFMSICLLGLTVPMIRAAEPQLAVINATVSSSEDGPRVASDYVFLPGDYVFVSFQVAGFAVRTENRGELQKISLEYEVSIMDGQNRPVVASETGKIDTELAQEDKNWVPVRRVSFLLPSFVSASTLHVEIIAKDHFGKTEAREQRAFKIGGVHVIPSEAIAVQNFRFFRGENDSESLSVPAFAPGDSVYARFEMTGFRTGPENDYRLAYGITVLAPDGKPYIQEPAAANLSAKSFYPAQFVPGNLELKLGKNSARGEYLILLRVRDLLGDKSSEAKYAFTVE